MKDLVKKHSEFIGFPIELYVEKSKEKEVTRRFAAQPSPEVTSRDPYPNITISPSPQARDPAPLLEAWGVTQDSEEEEEEKKDEKEGAGWGRGRGCKAGTGLEIAGSA